LVEKEEKAMRSSLGAAVVCLFLATGLAVPAQAGIKGDYIEVRSADVYTGPCFANSEMNLEGKQAILAWKVTSGSWDGVRLDGLSVVAVVRASATLGDRFEDPYPAQAILIVDVNGSAQQRAALAEFESSVFEAAKQFDNNFAFDFNGPWAPHNFVEAGVEL